MSDEPKCSVCGRRAWKSHGGMGGGIMPSDDSMCLKHEGRDCRMIGKARRDTLREVIELVCERWTAFDWHEDEWRGKPSGLIAALEEMAVER